MLERTSPDSKQHACRAVLTVPLRARSEGTADPSKCTFSRAIYNNSNSTFNASNHDSFRGLYQINLKMYVMWIKKRRDLKNI